MWVSHTPILAKSLVFPYLICILVKQVCTVLSLHFHFSRDYSAKSEKEAFVLPWVFAYLLPGSCSSSLTPSEKLSLFSHLLRGSYLAQVQCAWWLTDMMQNWNFSLGSYLITLRAKEEFVVHLSSFGRKSNLAFHHYCGRTESKRG